MFKELKRILGKGTWLFSITNEDDHVLLLIRPQLSNKTVTPIKIKGTAEEIDKHLIPKLEEMLTEDVKFSISETEKLLSSVKKAAKDITEKKAKKVSKSEAKPVKKEETLF